MPHQGGGTGDGTGASGDHAGGSVRHRCSHPTPVPRISAARYIRATPLRGVGRAAPEKPDTAPGTEAERAGGRSRDRPGGTDRRRHPVLKVERAVSQLNNGEQQTKAPKSAAGVRTVALPTGILPELRYHLQTFAEPGHDGRLFIGPKGATPRRGNFHRLWKKALEGVEVSTTLHLHDLRHTSGTMTEMSRVASGASFGKIRERRLPATLPFELDQGRWVEASSLAS